MFHFKNTAGDVFAYETQEDREKFGSDDLSEITEEELAAYLAAFKQVPASCTRRQGLFVLLAFGFKRADIEAQIAVIEDENEREEAQIEYEASEWERSNPRLQQMWAALGGTPAQLDDLFRLAVTL